LRFHRLRPILAGLVLPVAIGLAACGGEEPVVDGNSAQTDENDPSKDYFSQKDQGAENSPADGEAKDAPPKPAQGEEPPPPGEED